VTTAKNERARPVESVEKRDPLTASTAALPTASLREQIQTERIFASPVRKQ
jgi:hypothetical protein